MEDCTGRPGLGGAGLSGRNPEHKHRGEARPSPCPGAAPARCVKAQEVFSVQKQGGRLAVLPAPWGTRAVLDSGMCVQSSSDLERWKKDTSGEFNQKCGSGSQQSIP